MRNTRACLRAASFSPRGFSALVAMFGATISWASAQDAAKPSTPTADELKKDVVLRAMADELERSASKLYLAELDRPYFIQFKARERRTISMSADYGGLVRSDDRRTRDFTSRIRVGSMELDNTNFGRGGGRAAPLPLDDDYVALRHAIWLTADSDYKQAVETLTGKRAFLKDTFVEDRPNDFTSASPTQVLEPKAEFQFNRAAWEGHVEQLSARFKQHPRIQLANVGAIAGSATEWFVNTEGTRLRTSDTGAILRFNAEIQSEDGMRLSDSRTYIGETVDQWPPVEKLLADVDDLCTQLIALADAPALDHYSGPVLFEPRAAGQALAQLIGDELAARATPLGTGDDDEGFEKKIGLRILPRTFHAFDDPRDKWFEKTILAGAYEFDDEAVPVTRVTLVEKGILKTLVDGRAPTRKVKGSTGHARSDGFGDPGAHIGCLYVQDDAGVSPEELRKELIQSAKDEGLAFALRVTAIEPGGGESLGDPIYAYKVFVEDGHEQLVRGLKFLPVETRSLKRLLAGGTQREVYNDISGVSASVISPAVIFEELELTKAQQEFEKTPILKPPALRQ